MEEPTHSEMAESSFRHDMAELPERFSKLRQNLSGYGLMEVSLNLHVAYFLAKSELEARQSQQEPKKRKYERKQK